MIYLNLLSPSEKKIFRLACIEKMINCYMIVIVAAIAFLIFSFMGVKYFLLLRAGVFERLVVGQKIQEIAREIQNMEGVIKDFDFIVGAVNKIGEQKIEFYDILADFSDIIPDGIVISELSYNSSARNASGFVLEGKSRTREEFLIFTENIEQSPRFKEINSPLSNIIKKENINFRIEFKPEI